MPEIMKASILMIFRQSPVDARSPDISELIIGLHEAIGRQPGDLRAARFRPRPHEVNTRQIMRIILLTGLEMPS